MWRRIPVDVLALAAIVAGVLVTHLPVIGHGLCFNDPAYYFHFGGRVLDGDVPYRDFVFPFGPLPIYVDAGVQAVFGAEYGSSLLASLLVKIVRLFVLWHIARRLATVLPAALLVGFCAIDPIFAFAHHWHSHEAQLAISSSILFVVLGRTPMHLALAGASAGLLVACNPMGGVLVVALLLPSSLLLLGRREIAPRQLAALGGGLVTMWALLALVLAVQGALGDAIAQTITSSVTKTGVSFGRAVVDAVSGGALVDGRYSLVTGFLFFLGVPVLVVTAVLLVARSERTISSTTLALIAVPAGFCFAMLARDGSFELLTDLPRVFLATLLLLAVSSPAHVRVWFGVEPLFAVVVSVLAIGADGSAEMATPGRGYSDSTALVTTVILFGLASTHVTQLLKLVLCGGLAVAGIVNAGILLDANLSPFARIEAADGTFDENNTELDGVLVPEWRAHALTWLRERVSANNRCFVYGNLPALYDYLDCTNPTRLDSTIAVYGSAAEAEAAAAALRANPPDVILAHERTWMSPPIGEDLNGDIAAYQSWNPRASFALHMALRAIIDQYEVVGTVADGIGPEHAKAAAAHWDGLDAIRVYRRKR